MILVATDFSEDAGNAVRRATLLASLQGVPLELLHVVRRSSLDALRQQMRTPPDLAERLIEDAQRLLGETAAAAGAGASPRLAVGDVLEELLSSCARASMLVVGARGWNPLRDAILGTTSERLIGRCEKPILVVRGAAQQPYRRVLVALDLLPGHERVLEAAIATAPGATIVPLHAYELPFDGTLQRAGVDATALRGYRAQAEAKARAAIEALAAREAGTAQLAPPLVERTHPARLILDAERSAGAELVVIGKRRRSAVQSAILGSVTRHVLAAAKADLLVIQDVHG